MPISGAEVKLLSTTVHFVGFIYKKISVDASYKDSVKLQDRAAARMLEVQAITGEKAWSEWQLSAEKADIALKEFEVKKEKMSRFPANLNVKKRCALVLHANELHTKTELLDLQAIKSSRESRFEYTRSASSGSHAPAKTSAKYAAPKGANAPTTDAIHPKHTRSNHTRPKQVHPKQVYPKHTRAKRSKYGRNSRPCVIVNVINLPSGPVATTVSDVTGVGKKIGADAVRILEDFSARTQAGGDGSLASDSISMTESVVSECTEVLDDVASVISSGALTAQSTSSLAIDIVSLIDS